MEILNEINNQLEVIEKSLAWANQFNKESFNRGELKGYRRRIKKIKYALSEKCSAAAYGESQVGKSYLMDSLLGSALAPFRIINNGKSYSFINQINSSGGNNSKVETTGVITRFTINVPDPIMKDYVRIRTLSVLDLILLITDSYYNDVNRNDDELKADDINDLIIGSLPVWTSTQSSQHYITEDDIMEIFDYLKNQKLPAFYVQQSRFVEKIVPVIDKINPEHWGDLFGLLWNNNVYLKTLFQHFVNEYQKINFLEEVYVPFDAVLREKGTLLKIEWLNQACGMDVDLGQDVLTTDIYDGNRQLVSKSFSKASLSALIAELTFSISVENQSEKSFLNHIDLLDFPGARSREAMDENKFDRPEVMARIFRRGKVAYLFKKYSKSTLINSLLFCHHNDQKTVKELGKTISDWIEDEIGKTQDERTRWLLQTRGISPFFLVATKFNIDLKRNVENDKPSDTQKLNEHWKRFDTILPEIIKPSTWFDNWANNKPFQGVYPLRDYFWSRETNLFDGFSNDPDCPHGETNIHQYDDYPDYFDKLKQSFLNNPFSKNHFKDAEHTWNEIATPNNDGSCAIIRDLNMLAPCLDDFRMKKLLEELVEMKDRILKILALHYVSDNDDEKNKKIKTVVSQVRFQVDLAVYGKQELFGNILEKLMLQPGQLREIAYDIIVRKMEVPKDFSNISVIRAMVGINPNDNLELNVKKLCDYYGFDCESLDTMFRDQGLTVNDVVCGNSETLVSVADVLVKNFIEYWTNHINESVKYIGQYVSHANEIVECLQTLLRILDVKQELTQKITGYQQIFPEEDLPNAVAAMTALVLNNFVSTCGRPYMTRDHIDAIRKKAEICNINFVDLSDSGLKLASAPQSVEDVLNTLVTSENINRSSVGSPQSRQILRKLPLYDNFMRWENFLIIALLLASDVSNVDPLANGAMKEIIDKCNSLYNRA